MLQIVLLAFFSFSLRGRNTWRLLSGQESRSLPGNIEPGTGYRKQWTINFFSVPDNFYVYPDFRADPDHFDLDGFYLVPDHYCANLTNFLADTYGPGFVTLCLFCSFYSVDPKSLLLLTITKISSPLSSRLVRYIVLLTNLGG